MLMEYGKSERRKDRTDSGAAVPAGFNEQHRYRRKKEGQQDHKDPSDHIIISHAITEHLPLISSDTRFGHYRTQGLDFIYNRR